jgi:tripartite-type tricarboxylate transporter receptor subunit TctC
LTEDAVVIIWLVLHITGDKVALYKMVLVFFLLTGNYANAQTSLDYPNRPIRIIVAFPPGGSPDFTARVIGQQIGNMLQASVCLLYTSDAADDIL